MLQQPQCLNGHPVFPGVENCPKCGAKVVTDASQAPPPWGRRCRNGHVFTFNAAYCPSCGSPLYEPLQEGSQFEIVSAKPKSKLKTVLLLMAGFALLVVVVFICPVSRYIRGIKTTPTPTCVDQISEWQSKLNPLLEEWQETRVLAVSTPRLSLSGPITKLQRLAREIKAVKRPSCAKTAHKLLSIHLDKTIEGYILFMNQKNGYEETLEEGEEAFDEYVIEIARIYKANRRN